MLISCGSDDPIDGKKDNEESDSNHLRVSGCARNWLRLDCRMTKESSMKPAAPRILAIKGGLNVCFEVDRRPVWVGNGQPLLAHSVKKIDYSKINSHAV